MLLRETPFSVFGTKSEDDRGKTVEVFHILRPEMDRSGLELSIDNFFNKKYFKLNEKQIVEVYRAITAVGSRNV
jgi:hypothetical protein